MKNILIVSILAACFMLTASAETLNLNFDSIENARSAEIESFLQRRKVLDERPAGEQRDAQVRQEIQRHQEAMKNLSTQRQLVREQTIAHLKQEWTKIDTAWKNECQRHDNAVKQTENIPDGPEKIARQDAESAAHRRTSKALAAERQVVHEEVLKQANRDVMGGRSNASNSVKQTAGTSINQPGHSGMTSDFDGGGGYLTTEKTAKILNEIGVKSPGGGRVKMNGGVLETAPEFGMTINASPGTDRIGSAGHKARVTMNAAHGETYISETGGAVVSPVLKNSLATLDHAKKASHGLSANPETLVGGAPEGQAMAKGALKAAAQAELSPKMVTEIARQNGIKNPEKILDRLAEIKARQIPISSADEAAKLQGAARDILNAAEKTTKTKAAAEIKQIETKIAELKAQGQNSQAQQLRKELVDYRTKVKAASEVLSEGSTGSGGQSSKSSAAKVEPEPKASTGSRLMRGAGTALGIYGIYEGYQVAVAEMEAKRKGEPAGPLGWTRDRAELAARTAWHGLGFGAAAEIGEKAGKEAFDQYKKDIESGKISANDWSPYFAMKGKAVMAGLFGFGKAITYDTAKNSGTQLGTAIAESAGAGKAAYDLLKTTQNEKKTNEERALDVRKKLIQKGASPIGAQRAADSILEKGDFSEAKRLNKILEDKQAAKSAEAEQPRTKTLRERKKSEMRKEANKEEQAARENLSDSDLKLRETVLSKLSDKGLPTGTALVDHLVRVLERDGMPGLDEALKEITDMQGTFSGRLGGQGCLTITVTGTQATGTFTNSTTGHGVTTMTKASLKGTVDMLSAKISLTMSGTVTVPQPVFAPAAPNEPAWVTQMRATAAKNVSSLNSRNYMMGTLNGDFTGKGYKGLLDGEKEWSVQK